MKRTITVIYYREPTGKIQMREISIRKIGWLISGLIFLILVSILSAIFAVKLYADRSKLGSELASIRTEKESLEQRIKTQEASIHEAKPAPPPSLPEPAPKAKPVKPVEKPADSTGIKPLAVKMPLYQEGAKATPHIELQNFKAVKTDDNNQIIVAFDITKTNSNDTVVDGYVVTIWYYGEKHFSVPAGIGVKDGLPDDFKKGNRFSIKLQMHFEHTLPVSMDNPIDRLTIFVYSAQGELLAKKEEKLL